MHDDPTSPSLNQAATHPLIARLETECGYPRLSSQHDVEEFLHRPGLHCLFIPGDALRNLETADAAVILPELRLAFQNAFDCALIDDGIEAHVRETYKALKTPGFLFFRETRLLGDVQKVRDWSDYLARVSYILAQKAA